MKIKAKKIFLAWLLVANICMVLWLLASGYGGMVDPRRWALPAMVAMTFPLALIGTLMLGIFDLFTDRRQALIPLAGLLLSLGPILSNSPMNFSRRHIPDAQRAQTFSVLSYNVDRFMDQTGYGKEGRYYHAEDTTLEWRPNPTIEYMLRERANVCLMHEMIPLKPYSPLCISEAQIDSLVSLYPHRTNVRHDDYILSQYPLYPVELRQPEERYSPMCAAIANIQGHKVLLVSIHAMSFLLKGPDRELYAQLVEGEASRSKIKEARQLLVSKLSYAFKRRAIQAELLRQQIDSLGIRNVIIGGDFNDIADSYALRTIAGDDFKSAYAIAGFGPQVTYHADYFYFHIDHILYRGDMEAVEYHRGDCAHSDHYPIVATFVWSPEADKLYRSK